MLHVGKMASRLKMKKIVAASLVFLLLSGCISTATMVSFTILGGTLTTDEQLYMRYNDGLAVTSENQTGAQSIGLANPDGKMIVGAYIYDKTKGVSWVPPHTFPDYSRVEVNSIHSTKPASPAAYAVLKGKPKLDLSGNNYVTARFAVYDSQFQPVGDRTELFFSTSDAVKLLDTASNQSTSEVAQGLSSFTMGGVVEFRLKSDLIDISDPGNISLSDIPVTLYSGPTAIPVSIAYQLTGLTTSEGNLDKPFEPMTLSYDIQVDYSVESLTITPEVAVNSATVIFINDDDDALEGGTASNPIMLKTGLNRINIWVADSDATSSQTYTLNVYKQQNPNLKALTLSAGTLTPVFEPEKVAYAVEVANNVTEITVTASAADDASTLTVNGETVGSGTEGALLPLNVGDNRISVVVTTQDQTTKTYQISVTRLQSSNAALSGLELSAGTLSPAFTADKLEYTAEVANRVAGLTVTARTADHASTLTINDEAVSSGAESTLIPLSVGDNRIPVVVTAQNGNQHTYVIHVRRLAASGGTTVYPVNNTSTPISTTNGKVTVLPWEAGQTSLENGIFISIPTGVSSQQLSVAIEKHANPDLFSVEGYELLSPLFQLTLDPAGKLLKPLAIKLPADLKSDNNTNPSIYRYDTEQKEWTAVDTVIEGNFVTAKVDRQGVYAVLQTSKEVDGGESEETPTSGYSDIKEHWAEEAVKRASELGIVSGYTDHSFMPERQVSRAEFTIMLMKAIGQDVLGEPVRFTDQGQIPEWAMESIAKAVAKGIVGGYGDGSFQPSKTISRAEMAVMIARALSLPNQATVSAGFADDSSIPEWAKSSVHILKEQGILSGRGGNRFDPSAFTTRAEAITLILRLLDQAER
ncbi:cadherin-like beta sandwich domain-containing protein [Paenibacillus sp. CAU 1782]